MELQQGQVWGTAEAANCGKCACSTQVLRGGSRARRGNRAAATCPRPQQSWEDETNRRTAQHSHLSRALVLSKLGNKQLSLVEGIKLYWFPLLLEGCCGSTGQNPAVPLTSPLLSRTKCSQAWTRRCWKSIATALEKMRQTCRLCRC